MDKEQYGQRFEVECWVIMIIIQHQYNWHIERTWWQNSIVHCDRWVYASRSLSSDWTFCIFYVSLWFLSQQIQCECGNMWTLFPFTSQSKHNSALQWQYGSVVVIHLCIAFVFLLMLLFFLKILIKFVFAGFGLE